MSTSRYRVTVEGVLDAASAARFDDVRLHTANGCTVLDTEAIDQAALDGLIDRLRALRVPLVGLERRVDDGIPHRG